MIYYYLGTHISWAPDHIPLPRYEVGGDQNRFIITCSASISITVAWTYNSNLNTKLIVLIIPIIADFKVTLDLDSKQKTSKRLFLMESRQTSYSEHILLVQGKQGCREVNVYLDVSN